jgi:hypothetical protein
MKYKHRLTYMNQELWTRDLDSLNQMYQAESKAMTEALLQGADWCEVEDRRKLLVQLSLIIDRKKEGIQYNPAENSTRQ